MPYLDHVHDQPIVLDGIHNSINSLTYAVAILSGELLASTRSGVVREASNSADHTSAIATIRDLLDLFGGRRLDQDSISCHDA